MRCFGYHFPIQEALLRLPFSPNQALHHRHVRSTSDPIGNYQTAPLDARFSCHAPRRLQAQKASFPVDIGFTVVRRETKWLRRRRVQIGID